MTYFHLNGQRTEAPDGSKVIDLIEHRKLSPNTILVERNGQALHRSEWSEIHIQPDDRIEFIKVVAGG